MAIVAGIFGEFFIELAREKGWYDNPSQRLDAAMTAFGGFVTQTWFLLASALIAGLALGAWLDVLLRRRESVPTKEPVKASATERHGGVVIAPHLMVREVYALHFRNETIPRDGYHYIKCTFENCTLLYNGSPNAMSTDCVFIGNIGIKSANTAAGNMLRFLFEVGVFKAGVTGFDTRLGPVVPSIKALPEKPEPPKTD